MTPRWGRRGLARGIIPAMDMTPATRPSRLWIARSPLGWLATGFGAGFSPVAPGTAGTLVGLVLFWPLRQLPLAAQLAVLALVFLLGTWGAEIVARREGREDPGLVVVDEVVGMWISLLFVPFSLLTVVLAFFLFRVMDVVKPFPARQLESLHDGWGIMMDDVMAGIYANLALQAILLVRGWL
jgi:phosphatidylglycerophosphatase A